MLKKSLKRSIRQKKKLSMKSRNKKIGSGQSWLSEKKVKLNDEPEIIMAVIYMEPNEVSKLIKNNSNINIRSKLLNVTPLQLAEIFMRNLKNNDVIHNHVKFDKKEQIIRIGEIIELLNKKK